jgi:hypothetical protein
MPVRLHRTHSLRIAWVNHSIRCAGHLVQVLHILLHCSLVVRRQRWRPQTFQYFRDQVGRFLQALQARFDTPTPGFDIMLPVNQEQHLPMVFTPGIKTGIVSW